MATSRVHLHVDGLAHSGQSCFLEGFGQGGVGMDSEAHILNGGVQSLGHRDLSKSSVTSGPIM